MIDFQCPECDTLKSLPDYMIGQKYKCENCEAVWTVRGADRRKDAERRKAHERRKNSPLLQKLMIQSRPPLKARLKAHFQTTRGKIELAVAGGVLLVLAVLAYFYVPILLYNYYSAKGADADQRAELDEAIGYFTTAIRWAPSNPEGYLKRGHVHLRMLLVDKALDKADADFNKALELEKERTEGQPKEGNSILAEGYRSRAMVGIATGRDFRLVFRDLEEAGNCGGDPNALRLLQADAHHKRGLKFQATGNSTEAETDFAEAAKLNPSKYAPKK